MPSNDSADFKRAAEQMYERLRTHGGMDSSRKTEAQQIADRVRARAERQADDKGKRKQDHK